MLAIVAFSFATCQEEEYDPNAISGLKLGIKKSAIDEAKNHFLPSLFKKLNNITVPDQKSGKLKIKNIKLSVNPPDVKNVVFKFDQANNTLNLTVKGVGAKMSAKAEAKVLFVKLKGNVSVTISKMDVNLSLKMKTYQNGKSLGPMVDVTKAELKVSSHNVKVKVSGGIVAKFANVIVNLFKSKIVKAAVGAANKAAKSEANKMLSKTLKTFPLTADIPKTPFFVDYSLGGAPVVKGDHIELWVNGSILNKSTPDKRPPFKPAEFAGYNAGWKGIQFYLSPYVFNSALWSLYTGGFFNYLIKSEAVPKSSQLKLDTTTFGQIIPKFLEIYGAGRPIDLLCKATKQPTIITTNSDISGQIGGECIFQVRLANGQKDNALTVATDNVKFTVQARVASPRIYGTFKEVKMADFVTKQSKVGDPDFILFSKMINGIA